MRAVVTRVSSASVTVAGVVVGSLASPGLLVLLGVGAGDGHDEVGWIARKGRRPSWTAAAPGAVSEPLYEAFCDELVGLGAHVERGVFGADMQVASVNDGPFTILLETP